MEPIDKSGSDVENDDDCEIVGVVRKKRKLTPFPLSKSVPRNIRIDSLDTIEIQDTEKVPKTHSVLNPKSLSDEHKLLLSKRCTTINEYIKKYLKIMDDNGTRKSAVRIALGRMGLQVISRCLICRKIVLDDSNMQKHIGKHSLEEKKAQKVKKSLTQDIISNFVKQNAIPEPEIYKVPSKKYGFLKHVSYHLDKWFFPFASVKNATYKAMHGHNKGYYKDPDKFS